VLAVLDPIVTVVPLIDSNTGVVVNVVIGVVEAEVL
jgi:hypothetical protein